MYVEECSASLYPSFVDDDAEMRGCDEGEGVMVITLCDVPLVYLVPRYLTLKSDDPPLIHPPIFTPLFRVMTLCLDRTSRLQINAEIPPIPCLAEFVSLSAAHSKKILLLVNKPWRARFS